MRIPGVVSRKDWNTILDTINELPEKPERNFFEEMLYSVPKHWLPKELAVLRKD